MTVQLLWFISVIKFQIPWHLWKLRRRKEVRDQRRYRKAKVHWTLSPFPALKWRQMTEGWRRTWFFCVSTCWGLERDVFPAVPHCHFLLVPDPATLPFSPKANSSPSYSLLSLIILSNPLLSLECLKSLLINQAPDQPFWKTRTSGIQTSEIYPWNSPGHANRSQSQRQW